jgi:serine/threonine-protein kinase HipA
MNPRGAWSLSTAFDATYSYNPNGAWTATHQMTINGKPKKRSEGIKSA